MQYPLKYANRHGLIAGATGTGKSYTLASMAQHFTKAGACVFLVDAKGDLSGLARGADNVALLDCYGKQGTHAQLSIQELQPDLLARVLGLTNVQAECLEIVYAVAIESKLPLNTLEDLQAVLSFCTSQHREISAAFGLIGQASLAAISRALVRIRREGGAPAFGQPYDVADMLHTPGKMTILAAEKLINSPQLYTAFLIYILRDLYLRLPEVGDMSAPHLVLFLDEAHLIFSDMPPELVRSIERVVRLIRSKGVAVFFATQSPADIPPAILGQLGNRVQHGLRGATPQDLRAIRAAADTLPARPGLNAGEVITKLSPGEALYSFINGQGTPEAVQRAKMPAPSVALKPLTPEERAPHITQAPPRPVFTVAPLSFGWTDAVGLAVVVWAVVYFAFIR